MNCFDDCNKSKMPGLLGKKWRDVKECCEQTLSSGKRVSATLISPPTLNSTFIVNMEIT